jgi:alkanesulfonate monooxygenase SsuD/methylene tetrahydromethanopterin reductase-like flavin-dependent oxidoreductase (luciferase family)
VTGARALLAGRRACTPSAWHGTDPRVRMKVMRERMQAMQASWTSDEAGYHGEHVAFDRIWCWPAEIAG